MEFREIFLSQNFLPRENKILIYIYIGECVSVCVSFQAYTRRRLWSDLNQIWHTHADSPRKGSGQNTNLLRVT